MITLGIKHENLKKEVELLRMIYKKLSSKVVWDIILALLNEYQYISLTETEIAKKLNQSASNLSPHINFLLAINMLVSEDGNNEQLAKGSKIYLNEQANKDGYTTILTKKFDNMSPEEFKERYYPKKKNKKTLKDCKYYMECKESKDKKSWSCDNCMYNKTK